MKHLDTVLIARVVGRREHHSPTSSTGVQAVERYRGGGQYPYDPNVQTGLSDPVDGFLIEDVVGVAGIPPYHHVVVGSSVGVGVAIGVVVVRGDFVVFHHEFGIRVAVEFEKGWGQHAIDKEPFEAISV
mmetsp:Transcript_40578/g.48690  ORF Transcript_40578/g.48690 Transcript_40578/m.48690 type:complete len:129 (-) Transcript_40578:188-574(-)